MFASHYSVLSNTSFIQQSKQVQLSLDSRTTTQYSNNLEETSLLLGNNLLLRHLPSNKSSHRLSSRVIDDLLHPFTSRSRAFDVFVCANPSGLPSCLKRSDHDSRDRKKLGSLPLMSKCSKSDTPAIQKTRMQNQSDDLPKSTGREDPSLDRRGTTMAQISQIW